MKISKFFIILLSVVIVFSFCACNDNNAADTDIESNIEYEYITTNFTVNVVDGDGNAVSGVVLQLRKTSRVTACSNSKGIATFPLVATSGYKLSVIHCPDGYEYTGQNDIYINKHTTEYTIEISKK